MIFMISALMFLILAVLGIAAMGCVYYLCEIDTSFENDNKRQITVISNRASNDNKNNGNDVA